MTRRVFRAVPVQAGTAFAATVQQGAAQALPGGLQSPAAADCACEDVALAWLPRALVNPSDSGSLLTIDVAGTTMTAVATTPGHTFAFLTVGQILTGAEVEVSASQVLNDDSTLTVVPTLLVDTPTVRLWSLALGNHGVATVTLSGTCGGASVSSVLTQVYSEGSY